LTPVLRDKSNSVLFLYIVTALFYILGVWLHAPNGGANLYTDITTVFLARECPSIPCQLHIPYVQTFNEYPVIVSMFMYTMGLLGNLISNVYNLGSFVGNYYYLTVVFLSIPSFLLVKETLKIAQMAGFGSEGKGLGGTANRRVLLYVAARPSFVFMLLINWYVIGVYFAVFGLRKFLQGNRWGSGALIGLSAASNLVTAIPALGMLLTSNNWRERTTFVAAATFVYGIINLPFLLLNPHLWFSFWQYHYSWGIEGSWTLTFLRGNSPLRHYIFPVLFSLISAVIIISFFRFNKERENGKVLREDWVNDTMRYSWLFTFAFLFSSYVCTPQMNLILLPLFSIARIVRRYEEFFAFDTVNSGIGVALFYLILLPIFGTTYSFLRLVFLSLELTAILRSFWIGKMLLFDGVLFPYLIGAKHVMNRGISLIGRSTVFVAGIVDERVGVFRRAVRQPSLRIPQKAR
jgi:hypothetical protein